MVVIGIDPGLKGGICAVDGSGIIEISRLPSARDLYGWLLHYKGSSVIAYTECPYIDTGGRRQKGILTFLAGYGKILGALEIAGIPYAEVAPSTWQSHMGINRKGETKVQALKIARRLYPNSNFLATERSKVPHDGMIDALLIAHYGLMVQNVF
jgi:hypothetical protein